MKDRFVHWSHLPELDLTDDHPYECRSWQFFKPQGLWLTDDSDDSWDKWCEREEFGCGQHRFDLKLTDEAKLLWLKTEDDILEFTDRYGQDLSPKIPNYRFSVRWPELKAYYHGIMIFPYQWGLRLDDRVPWYYPWDCASGCVWKPKTALELIK